MNRIAPAATFALATTLMLGCAIPGLQTGGAVQAGLADQAAPGSQAETANQAASGLDPAAAPLPQAPPSQTPAQQVSVQQAHAQQAHAQQAHAAGYGAPAGAPIRQGAGWAPASPQGHFAPHGVVASHGGGAAHGGPAPHGPGETCTAGCCGTRGPVYPTMPPMAAYGLDPQEFLCDGGDAAPNAVVNIHDNLIGVGLEDTVVKYETVDGGLHIEPSNRVCIYAPRFASVRKVTGAVTDEKAVAAAGYDLPQGPNNIGVRQPSSAVMAPIQPVRSERVRGPDAFRGRDRGVPVENVDTPLLAADVIAVLEDLSIISDGILRDADKPWLAKGAAAAITWSMEDVVQVAVNEVQAKVATSDVGVKGLTVYDLPGGKLRVCKLADRNSAQVGDVVTFVLRVDNVGEGKLNNVVLTDNLTTRLEYIENTQTCSKGAIFETEENEGGSLRLTWKFTDDFKVGEAAIIRFRCRVR